MWILTKIRMLIFPRYMLIWIEKITIINNDAWWENMVIKMIIISAAKVWFGWKKERNCVSFFIKCLHKWEVTYTGVHTEIGSFCTKYDNAHCKAYTWMDLLSYKPMLAFAIMAGSPSLFLSNNLDQSNFIVHMSQFCK